MAAYYNEIDPYAAQWLRNLIEAGHIAPGDVDDRSIVDIRPSELDGYEQCHFFAGIGVWSHALRQAGWQDDRPIWTGSCPCQPFSAAGKRKGTSDERHLWPSWFHLIEFHRPAIVLGEQVASKDGLAWLDIVQADMEGAGYTCGAIDTCSAGVGAPHIRQRLRFAAQRPAHPDGWQCDGLADGKGRVDDRPATGRVKGNSKFAASGAGHGMANIDSDRRNQTWRSSASSRNDGSVRNGRSLAGKPAACPTNGFWRDVDWLFCRDGKWRPVEPGSFPLADGIANRVGKLRAYGNAVDAEATRIFIEAVMECTPNL